MKKLILPLILIMGVLASGTEAKMPKPQCPIQEFLFKCAEFKPKSEQECSSNAGIMYGMLMGSGVPERNASLLRRICEAACKYSLQSELIAKLFIQEVAPCKEQKGGK